MRACLARRETKGVRVDDRGERGASQRALYVHAWIVCANVYLVVERYKESKLESTIAMSSLLSEGRFRFGVLVTVSFPVLKELSSNE